MARVLDFFHISPLFCLDYWYTLHTFVVLLIINQKTMETKLQKIKKRWYYIHSWDVEPLKKKVVVFYHDPNEDLFFRPEWAEEEIKKDFPEWEVTMKFFGVLYTGHWK